jgi:hypothetical protein
MLDRCRKAFHILTVRKVLLQHSHAIVDFLTPYSFCCRMHLKSILLMAVAFFIAYPLLASDPNPPRIKVDLATNSVSINDIIFTPFSTIEEYERHLGKADRILQKRGVDHYFAYDQLGIALSLRKDSDIVSELVITYLNDGDGKIAKQVFGGLLQVNNHLLQPQTSPGEASHLFNVELVEVMNGYFLTPMQPLSLLFYYPQDVPHTRLKQIGIRFSAAAK